MLEVAVSIGILLIVAFSAFGSQVQSYSIIEGSQETSLAMTDLEVCMEEVLSHSADEIPAAYPAGEPIAAFDDRHLKGQSVVPTYPGLVAGAAPPDPLQITLTGTWQDARGRLHSLELHTVKAR